MSRVARTHPAALVIDSVEAVFDSIRATPFETALWREK